MKIIGFKMNGFNEDLLRRSEAFDALYAPLGEYAPRKHLLHVDYKENGRDMNRSHAVYQLNDVADEQIIADMIRLYEELGCTVSAIVEVNGECRIIAVHYIRPGFLEECRRDMMKMFQGHD